METTKPQEKQNDFSQGSIPKAILGMAGPITVAQLVNILYNLVDRMYIGHLPGTGAMALSGLGICMPVIMLVSAFSRLCGDGGAPFCSIERGRGNTEKAELIMGNSFFLLVMVGLIMSVMGNIFMRPILYLFGADSDTYSYAASYCRIYLTGSIFVMISLGMNPYINSQGFSKIGMLTVTIGAVINIILDPIFIFVFNMGVGGAALASVISQLCSALWVLKFLTGKKAIIKLKLKCMRLDLGIVKRITSMGIAGFVMSSTNSIVQGVANRVLLALGGSLYIGIMTVISSVREVVTMPLNGITSGGQPVTGYNYGAKKYDRVRESVRFVTAVAVIYTAVAWMLILLFPSQLMGLFTDNEELITLGVKPFRIYYMCFVFMSLQMAGQHSFTGMGFAKQAIFFSLFRKVIMVVPLMLILPKIGGLGVLGVFLAEPISDVVGGCAAYFTMYFTVYRKMGKVELHSTAD